VIRLRHRLVFVFLAATLPPLLVTLWLANRLLEHSLESAAAPELERLSRSLEDTARRLYQRERDDLRRDARSGAAPVEVYLPADRRRWPREIAEFYDQNERERFTLSSPHGDILYYLVRDGDRILRFTRPLGDLSMEQLRRQIAQARQLVSDSRSRSLRRAFLLLAAVPWLAALVILILSARRISRPIQELTAAHARIAAGDLAVRLAPTRRDELGAAMDAFNRMAEELQRNRERLLYLARLESWQALARKTAHEVKNSLTPIRLTMEELAARHAASDASFEKQAAQIVADEVNALERRIRAFSDFAAEPPVHIRPLDANALIQERVSFLKAAHPEVDYQLRLEAQPGNALADPDLLKAVLTNLLENAAEAAGPAGRVLAATSNGGSRIAIDVHDSGPGLSPHALETLFEPTISFKKGGMGLGLSIARKSALLCGGDIVPVKGELGGAGFRVLLAAAASSTDSPCPPATS
jgi:nitrogen fixation/metabolism regulation signal transduction histidine kinase